MTPTLRSWILTAAVIPSAVAAQATPPPSPRVVSYSAEARALARWTVGPKPLLEIGGADGTGPTEFTRIAGATRQRDGTLVVADGQSHELRFFDARGRFLRAAARRGQGPGEIEDLGRLFAAGDTLVVLDNRLKFNVYAPNGTWIRSVILPAIPGHIVNPAVGAFSAFDVLVPLRRGSMERVDDAIHRDSVWLARVSLRDTSVRIVLAQPLAPSFALGPGRPPTYPLGFAPRTLRVADRERICAGYPERYEILCTDAFGRPLLRIARAITLRSVTDSARRAYRDAQAGRRPDGSSMFQGSLRAHRERVAAATQFASRYPAYSELLFARTGELWVRSFSTADGMAPINRPFASAAPSVWSIYDRAGKWVADCALPPHFAAVEIGADYVLGVSRDEDDVERVTLLALKR